MKKYFALVLPFFVAGLLFLSPEISQANIAPAPKKITQLRPIKLTNVSRIIISPVAGKEKKKRTIRISKLTSENKVVRLVVRKSGAEDKKARGRLVKTGKFRAASKEYNNVRRVRTSHMSTMSPMLAGVPNLNELRQHYQDWHGTRYRAGGSSRAGVDCSGFTALTFHDVYGIDLPRTAHEQAMQGMPVDRDGLLPGDLVFFKRERGGDHVGIYLGNGKFMHASSRQGVTISSMHNSYWSNKFWKGSRL